jgi:hypothetical protein
MSLQQLFHALSLWDFLVPADHAQALLFSPLLALPHDLTQLGRHP